MLGQSRYSRAVSANLGDIEQRIQLLEQRLERVGGRASTSAVQTANQLGEAIASALSGAADRFRGGVGAIDIGDAAKLGNAAAKLGDDALRRVAREVEHRPLVTLAVAVGVGLLMGWAGRRR